MKRFERIIAMLLTGVMLLGLTGCSADSELLLGRKREAGRLKLEASKELTSGSSGTQPDTKEVDEAFIDSYNSYAFSLFQECYDKNTMMISPYSIYMALGLLANGADTETLSQIEDALGGLPFATMNAYIARWSQSLCEQSDDTKFMDANSVWINKEFSANISKKYLNACADYYHASVFSADMKSQKAVDDMNNWVENHTNSMIPKLIDTLDSDTVAVLMNAIAFDGKWEDAFEEADVLEDTFTHGNGTTDTVNMMNDSARMVYYEDAFCYGFSREYKGDRFSYRAFLPKEDVSIDALVEHMTEENYKALIQNGYHTEVSIGIPKYTEEYTVKDMIGVLRNMGIRDAFVPFGADFSKMADISLYVSKVIHKTKIELNEDGTKAAAATAIIMERATAMPEPDLPKEVYLNRSFIYMITDNQTGCPLFVGVYR